MTDHDRVTALRLLEHERAHRIDDLFVGHLQGRRARHHRGGAGQRGDQALAELRRLFEAAFEIVARELVARGQLRDEPALVEQRRAEGLSQGFAERSAAGAEFTRDRDDHALSEYPV